MRQGFCFSIGDNVPLKKLSRVALFFDLVAVTRADKCLVQRATVEIPRLE